MTDLSEQKKTNNLLVVQTAFIGDLLLSIPMLKALRLLYPHSEITVVVRQGTGEMLRALNLVDCIYEIKKGDKDSYSKVKKDLKNKTFSKIYCPHESLRSSLFIFSLNAEVKVTFKTFFNSLMGYRTVIRDLRLPDALRQISLLRSEDHKIAERISYFLNSKSHEFDLKRLPEMGATGWIEDIFSMGCRQIIIKKASERARLIEREGLAPQLKTKNIALFPGSVWNTKRWIEGSFIALSKSLTKQGYQVFIMGSPDEKELCDRVAIGGDSISLAGRLKLPETLILLTSMDLVVSNDSGSMHMAAVAEVPTVAIFGPTVLSIGYRPWQNKAIVVQDDQLKCRPCGKHGHKKCPIGTHECMSNIGVDKVINAITLLSSSSKL